jgi:DNA repair photolyase
MVVSQRSVVMKVTEIAVKGILTKSKLPESAFCINPYVGCLHGCVYCYARFMKRFTKHTEAWGTFLDVKANGADVIGKDLTRVRRPAAALLGSVTDAYQPLEKKYQVTRAILAKLVEYDFPVSILTKSDLVLRDLDLLRRLSKCSVGFSLMTLDQEACGVFEPHASSAARRIDAMRVLHDAGIETYVFIGPILPEITSLRPIFEAVSGIADTVWAERLNTRCGNWEAILKAVRTLIPDLEVPFTTATRSGQYWTAIGAELRTLSHEFHIPLVGYYEH